jgi:hypothetical protein
MVSAPLLMEASAPLDGGTFIFSELTSKLLSASLMSGNRLIVAIPDTTTDNEVAVITGGWLLLVVTVKLVALVAVFPATVTVMSPVVAPMGTVVVILVVELLVAVANVPLNLTVLFAGTASKFVPVMVTVVPIGPLVGVNAVMVGREATGLLSFCIKISSLPADVRLSVAAPGLKSAVNLKFPVVMALADPSAVIARPVSLPVDPILVAHTKLPLASNLEIKIS